VKTMTLPDFLDDAQIAALQKIWETDRNHFHSRAVALLEPAMPEIDRKLGQENDAGFLAYAIEYVFGEASSG